MKEIERIKDNIQMYVAWYTVLYVLSMPPKSEMVFLTFMLLFIVPFILLAMVLNGEEFNETH